MAGAARLAFSITCPPALQQTLFPLSQKFPFPPWETQPHCLGCLIQTSQPGCRACIRYSERTETIHCFHLISARVPNPILSCFLLGWLCAGCAVWYACVGWGCASLASSQLGVGGATSGTHTCFQPLQASLIPYWHWHQGATLWRPEI